MKFATSPPLLASRRALLLLLSLLAIGTLVLVQFGEFVHWIAVQQHFRSATTSDLVATYLIDKRDDPASHSNTTLDQVLAQQYTEKCVTLGSGHMEGTLRASRQCFSRADVQRILVDLTLTTSAVFTQHNITHFLDSGTLLGAVRHKNIIPFDQDADLGIDENGYEKLKKSPIIFPKEYVLHVFNSTVHPPGSRYIELPVRVVHRASTLYADVFVYLDAVNAKGDKTTGPLTSGAFINCRYCPKVGDDGDKTFRVAYEWIYPLASCRFAGYDLPCPQSPDKYLRHMFGKKYMTPVVYPY